jgi:hypothetical protein
LHNSLWDWFGACLSKMTPLTPSRVPLLLETTKVMKPMCSTAKTWLDVLARFCNNQFWEKSIDQIKFDRSTLVKIRSIDSPELPNFQAFPHEICHSSLIDLKNTKTQKLTKTSENNKAKGLTNVNQGVQIHNIWHSSNIPKLTFC